MSTNEQIFLLVEDNDDDVFLMRRALKEARIQPRMEVVMDGQAALDYLSGTGRFNNRAQYPVPTAVFLDLKLPYVHGFEVLNWIRQDPGLSDLPVVVLTSSPEERDREKARQLGAIAYLVKPPSGEMILETMKMLGGETVKR